MRYLIGIDIGTSATKTVLFNEKCEVVASASQEYPLYQPQNGWAEQEPTDWANAVEATIKKIMIESGVAKEDVKGIGLSGQMHGLVMLDKDNAVIRPSIIWCDQRTGKECQEITTKVGAQRLIEITANPALTGFTASKILWVRNHEAENYRRCRHILLPKDYIRFCMTGEYATEVSDASGMQLLDVPNRCWSQEILDKLEIDADLLPKVYESPEVTGTITAEFAAKTGLSNFSILSRRLCIQAAFLYKSSLVICSLFNICFSSDVIILLYFSKSMFKPLAIPSTVSFVTLPSAAIKAL